MRRRGGTPDNDYMSDQYYIKKELVKDRVARFKAEGKGICDKCGGVFDSRGINNHKRFCKGI